MPFHWVERDGLSPYLAPTEPVSEAVQPLLPVASIRAAERPWFQVIPFRWRQAGAEAYRQAASPPQPTQPALTAGQIMSAPVASVLQGSSVEAARALLRTDGFQHLPVVTAEGRIAGLLSERYLLEAFPGEGGTPPVDALMSRRFLTATPDTPIREIARTMMAEGVGCLPIVDGDGRIAGILTTSDLLRCIVKRLPMDLWV